MERFNTVLAAVIMLASIVVLVLKLFTPQPIQITLESGREITTESIEYYSLSEVLVLVVSAFLIGVSAVFLFYNADVSMIKENVPSMRASKEPDYSMIMSLLRDDERKVVTALRDSKGEMLQNALVSKLGLSKVKIARLVFSLQRKGMITKERHGLTNKIKLAKSA
jgi:uncharacterized membrane protein